MHTHKQYSAFEDDYVKATHEFYTRESETLSKDLSESPKEFFQRAIGLLASETERSKEVLPIESWTIVRETAEKGIFSERVQWLSFSSRQPVLLLVLLLTLASSFAELPGCEAVQRCFFNVCSVFSHWWHRTGPCSLQGICSSTCGPRFLS